MLKKLTLAIVIVTVSSLAFAQQRTQQEAATSAPTTTTCSYSYSSGPSPTFTRYCLSANGNIVQFDSPSGFEFINAGVVHEGYGFCDFNGGPTAYYDYADVDSGNWGPTTVSAPNATTRKFVRTTSDGIWQLTQTIKQGKATATSPGSVSVTMTLKNLTAINRTVYLLRAADVDANGTTLDDEVDFTWNSAWGSDPGFSYGLGLTTNTFSFSHEGYTQSVYSGPDPCNFFANLNSTPFVGDGSIGHIYAITVPKGSTKTVKMTYKPI
ncbi:MAG TPA: hypothetical protein VLT90_16030 [Terriglobales bacterium]|nr:hypothetical protein [Terriglobales bacterium]